MNSKNRIEQVLAENGWNRSELARQLNISPQAVQQWLRPNKAGKMTSPQGENLTNLAKVTGYPEHWFSMSDDAAADYSSNKPALIRQNYSDSVSITLWDVKAAAGHDGFINDDYPEVIKEIVIAQDHVVDILGRKSISGMNLINVPTDSMEPTIGKGDIAFVDTHCNAYDGEGVYIFIDEFGALYIKRLMRAPGNIMMILSDNNSKYPPLQVPFEKFSEFRVLAKFVKALPLKMVDL
ncbi:S24 family peptidase [Testudinibacter sp. TR-2022]|uniref:S24 family peptidase n=1 Tax=Testudinibacter sp. TR-2022 TaxID=2585029 RepID=UPI001118374B|nr:S24 family peptidase [Testudinibacter sp. TR-2022]TNH06656.1 LexA family transcriptional regulator [Pasteurellaceae bacterium Phil11]TNH24780.1 LexA family transcriptional regulator [Testudinibacter sp. TR-2022]TNH25508.1 LexA family transcriptional regulator [Testudinibacter sp. TR-2022]